MDWALPVEDIPEYYRSKEWIELRKHVLSRDKHKCQYCNKIAFMADHIMPRSKGGSDTLENLVACCSECNKLARSSVFLSFDAKKEYLLANGRVRFENDPIYIKRERVPIYVKKPLTGLRKKLALKNQPQHVKDAILTEEISRQSRS